MIVDKVLIKIRRFFNGIGKFRYHPTASGWAKSLEPLTTIDDSYFDPCCFICGNSINVLASKRSTGSISKFVFNETSFDNEITVLKPIEDTWESQINRPNIVFAEGVYWLFYTGQYRDNSFIGLAKSVDGTFFERISKNPIIVPSLPFEKHSVMNPCVLFDSSNHLFRMWYTAGDFYEPNVICYAESHDAISWVKHQMPVLRKGSCKYDKNRVGGCDVIATDKGFAMLYIGYENIDTARVCVCQSKDGIKWERDISNPLISPTRCGWDNDACYKPSFFYSPQSNRSYILYNGRKGVVERIGYVERPGKAF